MWQRSITQLALLQIVVPSPRNTTRANSTCKAIRMSIVGTQRGSNTCILRAKVVSLLAGGAKVVLALHDNLERRIVVIMHTVRERVTREYLVALIVCEGILVNT